MNSHFSRYKYNKLLSRNYQPQNLLTISNFYSYFFFMPSTVRTPKESLRLMYMSCHTYIAASKWRHNGRQMDTIYYWKKFWRGRKQGCLTQTPSLENTGNIACVEASLSPKTYRDRELEIVFCIGDLDCLRRRLGKWCSSFVLRKTRTFFPNILNEWDIQQMTNSF